MILSAATGKTRDSGSSRDSTSSDSSDEWTPQPSETKKKTNVPDSRTLLLSVQRSIRNPEQVGAAPHINEAVTETEMEWE